MTAVAPSFYGLLVLYPSIAAYFVSNVPVRVSQLIAFGGISAAIVLISI